MSYSELFGNPEHRALLRRGEDVWQLVRGNPRFAYYGTVVSLSDPKDDCADILARLARLQGLGMSFYFPKEHVSGLLSELEDR